MVCLCPPHTSLALNLALDTPVAGLYLSTTLAGSSFAPLGSSDFRMNFAACLSFMIEFISLSIASIHCFLSGDCSIERDKLSRSRELKFVRSRYRRELGYECRSKLFVILVVSCKLRYCSNIPGLVHHQSEACLKVSSQLRQSIVVRDRILRGLH